MSTEMSVFNYGIDEVRTIKVDGQPWFVAKDVSDVLGFRDPYAATRGLDSDEKLLHTLCVAGQFRETTLINESGLYNMIIKSKKPEANVFRKWITSEVLPKIRKTGMYATADLLNDPDLFAETVLRYRDEHRMRIAAEVVIEQQAVKLTYLDEILQSQDTVTISQIAADYGMAARTLNRILNEERVQRKVGKQWLLYGEYLKRGFTRSETSLIPLRNGGDKIVMTTKWTQAGRLFINELLKKRGNGDQQVAKVIAFPAQMRAETKLTLNVNFNR